MAVPRPDKSEDSEEESLIAAIGVYKHNETEEGLSENSQETAPLSTTEGKSNDLNFIYFDELKRCYSAE